VGQQIKNFTRAHHLAPAIGSADADAVLTNPHKGWYWHYYDNGTQRYHEGPETLLTDFPGLQTIYIRLPWCQLEPEEGRFRWELIDEVAARHVPLGRTLAFCVSCKETKLTYPYATPQWVAEAGAEGDLLSSNGVKSWEPDYGDPVFLEKLSNFHHAFADRYDAEPWVEWIDIGSYGDWGEGHTTASSRREWPVETLIRHFEMYRNAYRQAPLQVNDDFVGTRKDKVEAEKLRDAIDEAGFAITDHGVCVDYFARKYDFDTLRDPAWLRACAEKKPLVLELEHYHTVKQCGHWKDGEPFKAAIERTCASFAGFHGYPSSWLSENKSFARSMANRLGYWLFPREVQFPARMRIGSDNRVTLTLENRGTARPYYPIEIQLRLIPESGGAGLDFFHQVNPRAWLPGKQVEVHIPFSISPGASAGHHALEIRLFDIRTHHPIGLATVQESPERWTFLGWTDLENH